MIHKEKLLKKGWTIEEIEDAERLLLGAPAKRTEKVKTLDKVVFWGALLLVLVGNFVLSVMLIPFLLFATPLYLYPGMMFLGLIFGLLFDIIVIDIEKIEDRPVVKPGLFLFAVAAINIFIVTMLSNQLAIALQFERGVHTAILVSLVYIIGFMAPYMYSREHKFGQSS